MNDINDISEAIRAVIDDADKELMLEELGESEHVFSPRFEKKLKRKAALFFRNGQYVGEKSFSRSVFVRRAIAIACALVLFVGIAFNAEAIGDLIARWTVTPGESSTRISFEVPEGVEVPETIEERYVLTHIPDGYEQIEDFESPRLVGSDYADAEGNTLSFTQASYSGLHAILDTENAEFEELQINGYKGYYLVEEELKRLIWENGAYCFHISSSNKLELEELICMAETIETIDLNNE